MGRKRVLILAV